jgi:hypothetical protein
VKSFRIAPRVPPGSIPKAKRQRAGAVQNASRSFGVIVNRASVLECGGPPPLSAGVSNYAQISGICYMPAILILHKILPRNGMKQFCLEKARKAQIFFVLFAPFCG